MPTSVSISSQFADSFCLQGLISGEVTDIARARNMGAPDGHWPKCLRSGCSHLFQMPFAHCTGRIPVMPAMQPPDVCKDANLALRAVTDSLGPHSPSVWKSAAGCIVEHFVQQERLFLELYGYRVLTNRTWADAPIAGQTPILNLKTAQHIEQAGYTWYIISCELVLFKAGMRDAWQQLVWAFCSFTLLDRLCRA